MSLFFETILSRYQCGFRKSFSAQHCLLRMIEKLHSYGFDIDDATRLISNLTGRKQRVKNNQAYSSWKDII